MSYDTQRDEEYERENGPESEQSIPVMANCMVCEKYTLCIRAIDIGWVCLNCQRGGR